MPTKEQLAKRRIQELATERKYLISRALFTGRAIVLGSPQEDIPHLPHVRYARDVVPELTYLGRVAMRGLVLPIARIINLDSSTPGMSLADNYTAWLRANNTRRKIEQPVTIFDNTGPVRR